MKKIECQTTKRSESVEVRWPVRLFRSHFDKVKWLSVLCINKTRENLMVSYFILASFAVRELVLRHYILNSGGKVILVTISIFLWRTVVAWGEQRVGQDKGFGAHLNRLAPFSCLAFHAGMYTTVGARCWGLDENKPFDSMWDLVLSKRAAVEFPHIVHILPSPVPCNDGRWYSSQHH